MSKFTIYFIYHSHIDNGYTERQEKIAHYQATFVKQAIGCVLNNPKFKYTEEGFWPIEQFLKIYGNESDSLIKAIQTKRFELSGNYFHLAELLNHDNLNKSLDYTYNFLKQNNLPQTEVACSMDVNGFSYDYADCLYEHGIKYLLTNINTHHGGNPMDKPMTLFYWKTFKGKRILVYNGLTYHKGNLLGLIPSWIAGGEMGVPGLGVSKEGLYHITDTSFASERVFSMVEAIKKNGYEYDFLPICASGLYTDNSPVSDNHIKLIEEWNNKYSDEIEIKISTVTEMFKEIEKIKDIKEYSGDWNDWWTDGVMSTPSETRLFKNAQRVSETIKLIDKNLDIVDKEEFSKLQNNLMLYAEHTWGHSASYSDPYKLLVKQLDFRKANYAITSDILAESLFDKLKRKLGEGEFVCDRVLEYLVINPHSFEVNTPVYIPIDYFEEGFLNNKYQIIDNNNKEYVYQETRTLRGKFVVILITLQSKEEKSIKFVLSNEKNSPNQNTQIGNTFSGTHYKLTFNNKRITSLIYNEEVLDNSLESLGYPIYELFKNGNRSEAAGFFYTSRKLPTKEIFSPYEEKLYIKESGKLFTTLKSEYKINGCIDASTEYQLFNELDTIFINFEATKQINKDPEGLYVSFPFKNLGDIYLDKPNTLIKPTNQLPSTCSDYYSVIRGTIIENKNNFLVINSLDTPILSIERPKIWEFNKKGVDRGPLYFMVANNKWETNFRIDLSGFLETRFVIDFSDTLENSIKKLDLNDKGVIVIRK